MVAVSVTIKKLKGALSDSGWVSLVRFSKIKWRRYSPESALQQIRMKLHCRIANDIDEEKPAVLSASTYPSVSHLTKLTNTLPGCQEPPRSPALHIYQCTSQAAAYHFQYWPWSIIPPRSYSEISLFLSILARMIPYLSKWTQQHQLR